MTLTVKTIFQPLLLCSIIFVTACESKWEKMPDDELAVKNSECYGTSDPSAAMLQACKNYKRECERRRAEGIYAC